MPGFWKWCVRNFAVVAGLYSLALGQWGGLEWPVAFSAAAICGLVAKVGDWRYLAAVQAEDEALAALAPASRGRIVQFPVKGSDQRDRAA